MTKMTNKNKKYISEVAQPVSGDEKAFIAKHGKKVTDHPLGTKVPSITTSKKKRLADPEDTVVTYEEVVYNVSWCDVNGMNKKETGLAEDAANHLAFRLKNTGAVRIKIEEAIVIISEKEMTDTQMKNREDFVKGMKSNGDDLRKRYGKRWKDVMYAIATKNAMREETISEIAKSDEEPLLTQLQKRTNQSEVQVKFQDGKTHTLSRGHANKAISMLSGMRPVDREHAHSYMAKSHDHFMKTLNGQMPKPVKTGGISLAGPKFAKEEFFELEENHRVGVTYSDPNGSAVSSRSEKKFKNVRVNAKSEDEAIAKAKKHFNKSGYKVHGAEITTMKEAVKHIEELTGYRKKKPFFGKDLLSAVANRAIDRMKLPPNDGSKLSPEEIADNKKNRRVSQRAFDKMEEEVEELDEAGTLDSWANKHEKEGRLVTKDNKTARYHAWDKDENGKFVKHHSSFSLKKENFKQIDELGGQTTTTPVTQPVSRPKIAQKKTLTTPAAPVTEAGDVIPPKEKKMKSFGDTMNNFNLTKTRAKTFNVPTAKDRALEMDE